MKKTLVWRFTLLAFTTAVGLYYLLPSMARTSRLPSLLPGLLPASERVNLGLDLQGGMHLVLEVQTDEAIRGATQRAADEARRILDKEKIAPPEVRPEGIDRLRMRFSRGEDREKALGLLRDLVNFDRVPAGTEEILLTVSSGEAGRIRELSVRQSLEIIRNRVDQFGVSEPHILPEGDRRIVVELPGVRDPQRAIDIIGKTALLELTLLDEASGDYGAKVADALKGQVPEGDELLYGPDKDEEGKVRGKVPYLVKKQPVITGASLTDARAEPDPQRPGSWEVAFSLDREGAKLFGEATEANVGRRLAIVLDKTVYSAPVINTRIGEGRGVITGNFTPDSARDLAIVLRSGSLPAPSKIIANLTVGPSLGQDSIRKGVRASILGAILVVLLMAGYYRFSGLIADLALVLNLIMMVGYLAIARATLTLPGIAGIALTIGMAVDSNVLIFERIKEELRLGKTVRSAIDTGYDRAWVTVFDSHVTTLITAVALFLFGTGPIKGFAVTLSLGVAINLYTATVGTKVIFDWITSRWGIKRLSI